MLNLNRLAMLNEFRRRGTLHAASKALSYSPSTMSQQLRILEQEVGADLFERVGRGLVLTRAGELLADHAAQIFAHIEHAEAEIASVNSQATGRFKLATLQTAALSLLPAALDHLRQTQPQLVPVVSHISPGRALDALFAREFDLVLGEEYPGRPASRQGGIDLRTLCKDPLVLVAPPHTDPNLDALSLARTMPWMLEPEGTQARQWAISTCREMNIEPEVHFESPDLLVQMRLVETGHAIAILPKLLINSEHPRVRVLPLPGNPTRRVFTAYRSGAENSPAVAAALASLAAGAASILSTSSSNATALSM